MLYFAAVKRKKIIRFTIWTLLTLFILMNAVAYMHAYKFTHFSGIEKVRTKDPGKLTFGEKVKTLLTGIENPRPGLADSPKQAFKVINLVSNKRIECWSIQKDSSRGTVVLFHGYRGNKSSMIAKSDEFLKMGFSTFLVDFMGSGGSEGNQTTIGYKEADEVKTCFEFLKNKGENNIILFGSSMGSAAILRAVYKYEIEPSAIIIECPFGSMYKTTCVRFRKMGVPSFPMAGLLVFWGGVQNGFNGFSHSPEKYAKSARCPVLLIYGEKDERVTRKEIQNIFENIPGKKSLKMYPEAGHGDYLDKYKSQWISDISHFLSEQTIQ